MITPSDSPQLTPQWVWLARIRRAQGRKGEVFADILTDFPERFAERHRLWLIPAPDGPRGKGTIPPREAELVGHWLHKGGIVLHFAHSQSISDAEALSGLIVAIPLTERAPLNDEGFYIGDLIGCTLYDVSSEPSTLVGSIEDVDQTAGPVALLVIHAPGSREEILVPFAKSYLRGIDFESKRVDMALPEGLVNLNAAGN
jgi:16S rRNA processing protein RimM